MMSQEQESSTIFPYTSEVLIKNRDLFLMTWFQNIISAHGNRTLNLMKESELMDQVSEFLDLFLPAFANTRCADNINNELDSTANFLREISAYRAKLGFTPNETAMFVLSLKDAVLPILQDAFAQDRALLAREIINLNKVIDRLGLVTLESFVETREKMISDQNRSMLELAESANRSKSYFLASMSHEIRTPIHVITGLGSLLAESELSNQQREYVEIINRAGNGLLALVNDILDLSKIEAGQFELENAPFNVRDLLNGSISILSLPARDKGLQIVCLVDDDVPDEMIGDADRLRQIFLNLINNAIKFTKTGNITIHVTYRDNNLHAAVVDTGKGIPKNKQEIIFSPYMQSDSFVRRQHGGTGLGLTICRQLVEKMGGKIWVDSTIGQGSSFQFSLPLKAVSAQESLEYQESCSIDAKANSHPKEPPHEQCIHILMAEDAPENCVLFKAFTKKMPWTVDIAKDGSEAFLKYTTHRYDLVLMDIEMPVMDGYTATRAIRHWEQEQGRPRTPILALTAHAMRDHREHSLEVGCDGMLSKPISKDRLIQSIQEILTA
ncbi:MAG: response regulator [Magnetococcales bacterium]|nr:response regulator [Magnetococcales bacterium]